jgi:hypothetical protein
MRNIDEFPMADPGREKDARQLFDFSMSPEEYAAREGHGWYSFSFDDYRYSDPAVQTWIHRLGDILFQREGAPTMEELRAKYLTEEERRAIEQRLAHEAAHPEDGI